jgi:hypothetical protein
MLSRAGERVARRQPCKRAPAPIRRRQQCQRLEPSGRSLLSWTTHDSHARARPRFRSAMRKRACSRPRLGLLVIVHVASLVLAAETSASVPEEAYRVGRERARIRTSAVVSARPACGVLVPSGLVNSAPDPLATMRREHRGSRGRSLPPPDRAIRASGSTTTSSIRERSMRSPLSTGQCHGVGRPS